MKKEFSVGDYVSVSSKHARGNSYRGKIESISEKGTLTIFYPGSAREKSSHRRSKYGGYRGIWRVDDATLLREKWLATEPLGVYVSVWRGLGTTSISNLHVEALSTAADARRAAEELLGFAAWLEREPG